MAEDPRDGELERFLAERGGHLLRAAVLLTGSNEAGEDLFQAALEPRDDARTIERRQGPSTRRL